MAVNTSVVSVVVIVLLSSFQSTVFAADSGVPDKERQECNQELERIREKERSFTPGPTNDLDRYAKYADAIQDTWKQRNKTCYARLMSAVCGPLSSGRFKSRQQYQLARKYALSALEYHDAIPLALELELTGHVVTHSIGPDAPTEEQFIESRRKDVEVRLRAWKRLRDAIDPAWNATDVPKGPNIVGADMGLPSGIAPESVRDAAIRARYEAAIKENNQKIEKYGEQHKLRLWLKTFPKSAERYIIQAYSHPPCDIEELKKSLSEYKVDEDVKARILNAVIKKCDKEASEKQ